MPKIVIKEYDNTTAGIVSSDNFSVVIPGVVKTGFGTDDDGNSVFDENGVYECSDQSDFEDFIGKVPADTTQAVGTAPTVTALTAGDLTLANIYQKYYDQIYTRAEDSSAAAVGKLIGAEDGVYYKYSKVAESDYADIVGGDTVYYYIPSGYEGSDAQDGTVGVHYGNQMAYILLGLGYTVLYKKIESVKDLTEKDFWEPLKDRSIYDFRYIVSGLLNDSGDATIADVNELIYDVANNNNALVSDSNGRGDCIALLDIGKSVYAGKSTTSAVKAIQSAATLQSAYAAYFAPSIVYGNSALEDDDYNDNLEFPGTMHYLVCAAKTFATYPEWYAVSGLVRGLGSYQVVGTGVKLGDAAVNALQPRGTDKTGAAVNLIVCLNDTYYIYGTRTSFYDESKDDLVASDFLTIRQLCCTLKKQIYTTCRTLMFDPNSDSLWLNFMNSITPTLEDMKANQGITDYAFEKLDTTKKAKLRAAIRIVPVEPVEDFEIGVMLEDSIDSATISVTELL